MRRSKRLLSLLMTLAMALTLTDLPAFGMYVTLDGNRVTVSAEPDEVGIAASYDGDGRMLGMGQSLSFDDAQRVKVMLLDGGSLAPRAPALYAQRQDGGETDFTVPAGAALALNRPRDADLAVNGIRVGNAHVFGYDMPYGVYTGMERDVFENSVTDFAVYPGRWNDETGEPEFSDAPALRMADTARYEYNYNEQNGVNIFPKDGNLIDDPYQVRLELTLTGGGVVIYDTLWYKEGQTAVSDFAGEVRRRVGDELGAVSDDDRAAVESVWDEGEYGERLDDFAFAVKYGGLARPTEENGWSASALHCWNAWDDLRYGTAKAILESVYRAAWNDDAHTTLPDSVKLTDEQGQEWHGDDDAFPRREADEMLDAFEDALPPAPQRETGVRTITVKRAEDGWYYVLFDGAADTEENRQDANLRSLRFTGAVTVTADDSARDGWLGLRNCAFEGGLTVEAPAAAADEDGNPYGRFTLNFHDSCTGAVTVAEAADDAAAREALIGSLRSELAWETEERLFYRDAVGLERADGMTVTTGGARVGVGMEGGTVTVNGVTCASDAPYTVSANRSVEWTWDNGAEEERLSGSGVRLNVTGSNYDVWDDASLERVLTLMGNAESDLYLRGIADVSGLSVSGHRLYADFDRYNWSNAYLTLADGQEVYTFDNSFDLELWLNGAWVGRPAARRDNGGVRIDVPAGFEATVWQRRDGALTDITDELEKDEYEGGATFMNPADGWDEENGRWNPLNDDSVYVTQVRLERDGAAVIFDPVPREWERPVSLGEFGGNLLSVLQENERGALEIGGYTVEDYLADGNETLDAAAVERFERIWTDRDFDGWSDPGWRARVAFTLSLLPDGVAERYGDPGDAILWGDAKAALTAALTALGGSAEDAAFQDGGWQDDYALNQDGRDDLFSQFIDRLPPLTVEGDCEIVLSRREDYVTYYTINGRIVENNEIFAKRFTGRVTVSCGGSAAEGDDWGGDLYFRNCFFDGGLTVLAADDVVYSVDFGDRCGGAVTVETAAYRRVELRNVGGMTVQADSGVYLDATQAADGFCLELSRYELSAGCDDDRLNFAQAAERDGYAVELRLSGDFLSGEALGVALDGEPLPFACEEDWDSGEYVLTLRAQEDSPWFNRDSLDRLTVTAPIDGASLTFTPGAEWERPARLGDLLNNLLALLVQREIYDMDDLRDEYGEAWDDYLEYGEAMDVLGGVWQRLRPEENATLGLDGKADDAILTMEEMSLLVWGQFQNRALDGEYAGDSAQALQALLDSGRSTVVLAGDTTLRERVTVPQDVELIVAENVTLTLAETGGVTVDGTLVNIGTLTGAGTLAIGESGCYVNELSWDGSAAALLLDAAQITDNGTVICCVPENESGELVRQPVFAAISSEVDYRAVVTTKNGFDNANHQGYNGCIIRDNGVIVGNGEIGFERLVIYGGSSLTVESGTLRVASLNLRGGELLVGQDAALTLTGESQNEGSLTVDGTARLYGELQNERGGVLRVNGGMELLRDPETDARSPLLVNRGELTVSGSLTLKDNSDLVNETSYDETGVHPGSFTVAGVVTVGETAGLVNSAALFFENGGRIEGNWINNAAG